MGNVRITLNPKGMAELLHHHGVVHDLERRMERVRDVAQQGAPQHDIETQTVVHPSRTVARAVNTSPDAVRYEADHGTLARAFHQAGGE